MSKLRDHRRRAKQARTLAKLTQQARRAAVDQVLTDLYERGRQMGRTWSVKHAVDDIMARMVPMPAKSYEMTVARYQMSFVARDGNWRRSQEFECQIDCAAEELANHLLQIGAIGLTKHYDPKRRMVTMVWECLIGKDTTF
jgi:hypothetical protein